MFVPVCAPPVSERIEERQIEERQTRVLPPRTSLVVLRSESEALFAKGDDSFEELSRPYAMFFDIADLLLSAEMPVAVCAAVLSMAKWHWRHERCQYFSGIFS